MKLERLKRLLTLAFLSDKDHERIASLDAIKRILAANGRDAHWLVENAFLEPPAPAVRPARRPEMRGDEWGVWLEYVSREPVMNRLRPREQEFIDSLVTQLQRYRYWSPTEKQGRWLYAIYTHSKITEPFG